MTRPADSRAAAIDALIACERALHHERQRHARLTEQLEQLRPAIERLSAAAALDLGDLRRISPISNVWGADRGLPIDRRYIARFLDRHRESIRGRVLEVKDPGYTHLFGDGRVTAVDVLDVDPTNPRATIIADITRADAIRDDTYDCVVLTQVLGLVYDVHAALTHVHRILKPGGVLLCSVPASGRLSCEGTGRDGDYWRFTEASVNRVFAEVFPPAFFEVEGFGNALAAATFLYGLADHELSPAELDAVDPFFPVVYTIRAEKPERPSGAILMYHRIGEALQDPYRLCVTPAHFRAHLEQLAARGARVVSLRQLGDEAAERRVAQGSIAITFDDGYRDTLTAAAPILRTFDFPATVFVMSGAVDGLRFPWAPAIEAMSADDVRQLAAMPGITIGAHTRTHPRLPGMPTRDQRDEMTACKTRLEALTGSAVSSFAYPFGALDPDTVDAAAAAGFDLAVTTQSRPVSASTSRFQMPRLEVHDCDGSQLIDQLRRYGVL